MTREDARVNRNGCQFPAIAARMLSATCSARSWDPSFVKCLFREVDVAGALDRVESRQGEGVEIVYRDAVLSHDGQGGVVVAFRVARDASMRALRDGRGGGEDQVRAALLEAFGQLGITSHFVSPSHASSCARPCAVCWAFPAL